MERERSRVTRGICALERIIGSPAGASVEEVEVAIRNER